MTARGGLVPLTTIPQCLERAAWDQNKKATAREIAAAQSAWKAAAAPGVVAAAAAAPSVTDVGKMKVAELKAALSAVGAATTGKKDELVARLRALRAAPQQQSQPPQPTAQQQQQQQQQQPTPLVPSSASSTSPSSSE